MATSFKVNSGSWRVQVRRKGKYVNETFLRRKDAEEWALEVERRIDRGEAAAVRSSRVVLVATAAAGVDLAAKRGNDCRQRRFRAALRAGKDNSNASPSTQLACDEAWLWRFSQRRTHCRIQNFCRERIELTPGLLRNRRAA